MNPKNWSTKEKNLKYDKTNEFIFCQCLSNKIHLFYILFISYLNKIESVRFDKLQSFLKLTIIDPHLDLEVETGWDSRFSVFLGSKSKFTLGSSKISMENSIF